MSSYVLELHEIDRTQVGLVGGKAAQLGELSRIDGVRVPGGFCVTTEAFRSLIAETPSINEELDRLSRLGTGDRDAIRSLTARIRRTVDACVIPDDVAGAILRAHA